jgi:hypothetical protein
VLSRVPGETRDRIRLAAENGAIICFLGLMSCACLFGLLVSVDGSAVSEGGTSISRLAFTLQRASGPLMRVIVGVTIPLVTIVGALLTVVVLLDQDAERARASTGLERAVPDAPTLQDAYQPGPRPGGVAAAVPDDEGGAALPKVIPLSMALARRRRNSGVRSGPGHPVL